MLNLVMFCTIIPCAIFILVGGIWWIKRNKRIEFEIIGGFVAVLLILVFLIIYFLKYG